ncbi:MAG: dihydroorotase family protein [Nanoarchaeota archaeon]|nr:dihydroorotase family protein [Nanoarchaeota archaeon]
MSLLITNAKILVDGKFIEKNIFVDDGLIKDISVQAHQAGRIINASGKLVIPGIIDVHVHMRDMEQAYKEDWMTGSMAAAHGGVTTVFDMVNNSELTVSGKALENKRKIASEQSIVNFGLFFGISENNLDELEEVKSFVCGYKLIMDVTTGDLSLQSRELQEKAFEILAGTKKIVSIHAEDAGINREHKELHKGRTDPLVHSDARPNESEAAAVRFCIDMAEKYDTRINITHLSTKEALALVEDAKKKGLDMTCDTTPSYLFLTREDLENKGALAKMNPPVRSIEDKKALWRGVRNGSIDMLSTDHAPHTLEEKSQPFLEAPSGLPHLDTFLPMLLNEVNNGHLAMEKLVELTSKNPAKIFSIKNKGELKIGYDADIVIVDMDLEKEVKKDELFTKSRWSPFEGRVLKGWPVMTIVNGKVIFEDGRIIGTAKGKEVQYF